MFNLMKRMHKWSREHDLRYAFIVYGVILLILAAMKNRVLRSRIQQQPPVGQTLPQVARVVPESAKRLSALFGRGTNLRDLWGPATPPVSKSFPNLKRVDAPDFSIEFPTERTGLLADPDHKEIIRTLDEVDASTVFLEVNDVDETARLILDTHRSILGTPIRLGFEINDDRIHIILQTDCGLFEGTSPVEVTVISTARRAKMKFKNVGSYLLRSAMRVEHATERFRDVFRREGEKQRMKRQNFVLAQQRFMKTIQIYRLHVHPLRDKYLSPTIDDSSQFFLEPEDDNVS